MAFYLNLVFAWIAMFAAVFLAIIFFLRVMGKGKKIKWTASLNRALRKNHKSLGVILIIFGLVHGILSSDKAIGFNLGTLSWVLTILLGLSFVYRKRFNPQRLWMSVHRLLSVLFALILVIHISDVGGFVIDDVLRGEFASTGIANAAEAAPAPAVAQSDTVTQTQEFQSSPTPRAPDEASPESTDSPSPEAAPAPSLASKYSDGIYQGTADGFRPGLTVEVEIKNDEIIRLEVISHNEQNRNYWGYPVENIPKWIVAAQSTDVDTVSGATYTSRGIIAAAEEALGKALR